MAWIGSDLSVSWHDLTFAASDFLSKLKVTFKGLVRFQLNTVGVEHIRFVHWFTRHW